MDDAAAARREARRRRILENSQDRLQRIAGKSLPNVTNNTALPVPVEASVAVEELSIPTPAHTLAPLYNGCTDGVPPLNLSSIVHDSPELNDFLQNLSEGTSSLLFSMPGAETTPPAPTTWERLSSTKLDILLMSFLVQVTYSLFWEGSDSANVFLPLLAYDATKLFMQRDAHESGVVSTMLLMNGLSPMKVNSIMRVVRVILTFAQDICIYLFFTVCTQSLFIYFYGKKIQLA